MQASGIYASSECKRDPRTGTFANRFCHHDKDCCYTLEFVKSKRNPCRMECRDAPPGSGGSFLLSPTQTCQFAFSSGYESQCEWFAMKNNIKTCVWTSCYSFNFETYKINPLYPSFSLLFWISFIPVYTVK